MRYVGFVAIMLLAAIELTSTASAQERKSHVADETKGGKACRMEQQCHWENFKKICTYVKVCR